MPTLTSRRRVLQGLLASVPTTGLLGSGIGRSSPPAGPPRAETVRILMPAPLADATAPAVQQFNRRSGDVQIAVSRGPLDTETLSDLASSSLLLGDSPFDLLLMDVSWTPRYVAAGWLQPLETLLGPGGLDGLVPAARLGNAFGGHLWRMPLSGDTALLYWRKDLLPHPPRDTLELEAMARELQKQGKVRWGYVWQGRQYEGLSCVLLEVLHAFGGRWWDGQAGRTDLSTPQALAAIRWLTNLVREGVSPPGVANFAENDALDLFRAGEVAFLRNWPYAWQLIAQENGPITGKVGVAPLVGAPGHPGGGTLGTWGLSLLAGCPRPMAAARVIRWLTGPEVQRDLVRSQGYAPTWQSLYDDEDLQASHPLLQVQAQALRHPLLRPLTPLYAQISDVLQRQGNALFTSDLSPEVALARAQRQSDLLMRAAGAPTAP
ncbi:MAG: extracellular solute-binding protein [Cyanobacteriota bacterium]|jgi:multiple sugar transport system substrate-binding protein|nr:extracellular solute-binding protein [Cyanobacteriota bacterium]